MYRRPLALSLAVVLALALAPLAVNAQTGPPAVPDTLRAWSIVPLGQPPSTITEAGRLQVIAADTAQLVRGDDGLMRTPPGTPPPAPAAGAVLTAGAVEGSNVDGTAMLVSMIQLARQFEMQVRVLQSGDENARAANSLLSSR